MAADLHIHVFEGLTEAEFAAFHSNTIGSKYFAPVTVGEYDETLHPKVGATPNIWVGEVSWLKAALLPEEADHYLPGTVVAIHALIDEDLPVVDDGLIAGIRAAFTRENDTGYGIADPDEVVAFLEAHRGQRVFTVSW